VYFRYSAVCICDKGRVRSNNEDNFLFDGRCLPPDNAGLREPLRARGRLDGPRCFAVFDGMGGETHGELAAHTAAETLRERFARGGMADPLVFLRDCCGAMNEAVCAQRSALGFGHMGTTVSALLLGRERAANPSPRLDLVSAGRLEFRAPDNRRFPALATVIAAGRQGGLVPAYINGANEVLVAAFLGDKLPYPAIGGILGRLLEQAPAAVAGPERAGELAEIFAADAQGRADAGRLVEKEYAD